MSVAFTIRRCGIISALQPFEILFIALKLGLRFSFVFPEVKLCDTVDTLKQTFGINNVGSLQATLERAGINLLHLRVNVKSRKRRYCIFPLFAKQINFLKKMKEMAAMYGYDISMPAKNTREAIQWTYFAYLASIKEQNGAAMSLGRTSTFFDIYVERDMKRGILTEEQAQELIDDFVMKLRSARHLRTPEYNELFGGDPIRHLNVKCP